MPGIRDLPWEKEGGREFPFEIAGPKNPLNKVLNKATGGQQKSLNSRPYLEGRNVAP